jgi:hypothetical protein
LKNTLPEPALSRHRRVIENLVIPLTLCTAIAAFFILTNQSIPFANGGNCDPWYFFGRFFLADQVPMLGSTRTGSRIPAAIIGVVTTRLFRGVTADYANFLILFVSAGAAVYFAAKRLFGVYAAIFATIFFATEPLNIGNFSVTFSAPTVAYSAIAMALAVTASTMTSGIRRAAVLLTAGFFWASAIHGHLYSLSYNFIVTLYCLDWGTRQPIVRFLRDAMGKWILLMSGALIATIFFGLINHFLFHGSFFFFEKQYDDIFTVLVAPYVKPNWYFVAGRGALLLLGAAVFVVQGVRILRSGLAATDRGVLTALIPFGVLELAQIAYTIHGGITLQYDYYFVWLLAPLALLVASLVRHVPLTRRLTTVLCVFLAACLLADFGRFDVIWQGVTEFPPSLAIAVLIIPALFWLSKYPTPALLVIVLLLAGLNGTIRPEKFGAPLWDPGNGRDVYSRLRTGMEFISSYRFEKEPKFWLNTTGPMWETIAYPRSYNYCLIDTVLPNFLPTTDPNYTHDSETFAAGDYLVMVPHDADALAKALKTLSKRGLRFQEIARKTVSEYGLDYLIVIGRLRA